MVTELFGNAALWPAEQIINRIIETDDHAQKLISNFDGKVVQVNVTQPNFPIRVNFESHKMRLTSIASADFELAVDATVTASATTLSNLLLTDSSKRSLVSDDLTIEGDTHLVQDLFTAMNKLDIEWEDLLSPVLGDIGTNQLSEFFNSASDWLDDSRSRMKRNVDDYLKEEAKLFPSTVDLENWQSRLDQLRLRIDRSEARIQRLSAQFDSESN